MPIDSLRPLPAADFDVLQANHLLVRAGFGGTPAQVTALTEMGLAAAVDFLVDYEGLPQPEDASDAFDADIIRPPTEQERAAARRARQENDEPTLERLQRERNRRLAEDRRQMAEIQRWWLTRMIETGRPLEEKMTLFWHGHFATGYRTIEDSWHMLLQNQLFRRHATGNFATLCAEAIRDPALLEYLDNDQNRRRSPNENLARELMELFVLGEGTGYTERDIKEAARALTGYTFEDDRFVFRREQHDDGAKTIFGESARLDGDGLVRMLLGRTAASEFICWKLYRFFVDDSPAVVARTPDRATRGFIVRLAELLREERFELKPVLRTLFRSAHFHHASKIASTIKSPVQLVVQCVRSLNTPVRSLISLVGACELMGQTLFQPPNVKGWDGGRSWINTATVFVRQNALVYLLTGRRPDQEVWENDATPFDATPLLAMLPRPSGEPPQRALAQSLLRFMLGVEPRSDAIDAVSHVLPTGAVDNDALIGALALIGAMPEYQLC